MRTMEQVSCQTVREIPIENTAPRAGTPRGGPAVLGKRWMVTSSHYLASQAGASVFQGGGNAIDAGVAAGIALNVLERHLTDFGGVAPIVLFQPGMAAPETIDGLGRWPASLTLAEYRTRHGDDMPIGVAQSVTPAACDAWLTAVARHGRLTLAEVLAPNIELAEGFPVYPRLARAIAMLEERIRQWPSSAKVFLPGGRAPRVGEILVQSDLAALFRTLVSIERANAAKGRAAAIMAARDAIYTGDIARAIVESQMRNGGAITAADLASYHVKLEPPAHTTYRGIDVFAGGPWSQGPLVPMTRNLLEGNAFSATPSDPGLGAPLVDGLGIIVSTRGAQLWTTPGHPSAIAPRKRPRLTPNPALLMKDGRALMPFGCPGEDAQCQAMVQTVCNVVDFGMNLQAAIEAPRVISRSFPWTFHPHAYEPGVLTIEGPITREVRDGLAQLGHAVRDLPDFTPAAAGMCAIRELEPGTLEGGADPRRESYAIGW